MKKKWKKNNLSDTFLQHFILVAVFHPEHNERVVNLNNAQGLKPQMSPG